MRAQLRNMLASIGIDSPQFAVSASMAMRRLRAQPYDLILSEYDLGEGQDGQHLLEDLRQHGIIPPDTVFVMITGERNYERVITPASSSSTTTSSSRSPPRACACACCAPSRSATPSCRCGSS